MQTLADHVNEVIVVLGQYVHVYFLKVNIELLGVNHLAVTADIPDPITIFLDNVYLY